MKTGAIVATLAMAGISAVAAPFGLSRSDSNNVIYSIDLSTGVATAVGPSPTTDELEGFGGIGSTVYGITEGNYGPGTLWNVVTGVLVGSTGDRLGTESGLAYDPVTGFLYNTQGDELSTLPNLSWLYRVDPATGAATFLGGDPVFLDNLAINTAGQAYAVDFRVTGSLYGVNLTNGAATLIGSLGIADLGFDAGAAFDPSGTLRVLREDGSLYTVNTATGAATFQNFVVDAGGNRLDGDWEPLEITPAAVPEPSTFALLGSALAAVLLRARARRSR